MVDEPMRDGKHETNRLFGRYEWTKSQHARLVHTIVFETKYALYDGSQRVCLPSCKSVCVDIRPTNTTATHSKLYVTTPHPWMCLGPFLHPRKRQ